MLDSDRLQEALEATLQQQTQARSTTTKQLARPGPAPASTTSLRPLTISVPTGTFTITFICTACGQESVNVGVKPSPLPQWGLNCSHCGGLNGSGSYSQFEEFKITEAPERAADWDKADMEVEGSSVPDTLSGEFYIVEVTEQAADCDEAGMEEEGMVATAC